jgi:ABC-type dipeptide/oligopeptide/nickel transport systems, permease components
MINLLRNKLTLSGAIIIVLMSFFAVFAPVICHYQPDDIDIGNYLLAPSATHWLGTDLLGRDLFSRMVYGARISLSVGLVSIGIAVVIGIFFGALAGYYGGVIDTLVMRFVDIMLCFPVFSLFWRWWLCLSRILW